VRVRFDCIETAERIFKEQAPSVLRRAGLGSWSLVLLLSFELCSWNFATQAAAPTLDHFYPIAVQIGSTNAVTAIGKFDPWPPKVWVDAPGIVFNSETNAGKLTVEIATNAPAGPHLVRVFNEQGASGPRFLIVTREPQAAEQEPNDDFMKPQAVDHLPVSLNGRLDKSGDVDSFAVTLEAGQTLIASLEAYTLASPMDAVLRLVDSRGVQLALNDDDGCTLDPLLAWTANSAGTYILQVFGFAYPAISDVKFAGGNACVYRLHLSRGRCLQYALPLGVQRGVRTKLRLFGWNMGSSPGREFEFDGTGLPAETRQVTLAIPDFENAVTLPVGDGPELIEREPNNSTDAATPLDVPSAVTGCIDKAGDEDRFTFSAKKSERLLLKVQSASLGFPLDARLKLEDAKGKELVKKDDKVNADPALEWTAPEDGTFFAAVGNVLHRGGSDYLYRLSISRAVPGLKAVVGNNAITIEPGKTNDIKITTRRLYGFQSKLTLSVKGLPEGLAAEDIEVPEKGGEAVLKLVASADAKPFSGVIQFAVTELESGIEQRVVSELISSTMDNGVPQGFRKLLIESTDKLWLTLLPAPAKEQTVP
jgi:Bacterial pre-peptidase C-terminal domain